VNPLHPDNARRRSGRGREEGEEGGKEGEGEEGEGIIV
jgi:hypothetical protein